MILSKIAWVSYHLSFLYGMSLDRFLLREIVGDAGFAVGVLAFAELYNASSHEGIYFQQPSDSPIDRIIAPSKLIKRNHLHRLTELDWQEGWEVRGDPPMCHLIYTPPQAVPGLQEWLVKSWL